MRRQRPIITRAIRRPCNRQVMLPQWELNHSSAARGGLSAETRAVLDMVVRSSPLAWALRWGARPQRAAMTPLSTQSRGSPLARAAARVRLAAAPQPLLRRGGRAQVVARIKVEYESSPITLQDIRDPRREINVTRRPGGRAP